MNTQVNKSVKPSFRFVKIDETEHWNPEFVNSMGEGTKIIATYAYDETDRTFCCELSPSHWMEYLGTDFFPGRELTDEENEEAYGKILEGESSDDASHYRQCWDVKKLDTHPVTCDAETLEDVRECFQANPW